jgi:hypothetical protein
LEGPSGHGGGANEKSRHNRRNVVADENSRHLRILEREEGDRPKLEKTPSGTDERSEDEEGGGGKSPRSVTETGPADIQFDPSAKGADPSGGGEEEESTLRPPSIEGEKTPAAINEIALDALDPHSESQSETPSGQDLYAGIMGLLDELVSPRKKKQQQQHADEIPQSRCGDEESVSPCIKDFNPLIVPEEEEQHPVFTAPLGLEMPVSGESSGQKKKSNRQKSLKNRSKRTEEHLERPREEFAPSFGFESQVFEKPGKSPRKKKSSRQRSNASQSKNSDELSKEKTTNSSPRRKTRRTKSAMPSVPVQFDAAALATDLAEVVPQATAIALGVAPTDDSDEEDAPIRRRPARAKSFDFDLIHRQPDNNNSDAGSPVVQKRKAPVGRGIARYFSRHKKKGGDGDDESVASGRSSRSFFGRRKAQPKKHSLLASDEFSDM